MDSGGHPAYGISTTGCGWTCALARRAPPAGKPYRRSGMNAEHTGGATLIDLVDAAWAEALGCSASLLHSPGPHLVPGGPGLSGLPGVYMARLGGSVLVYAPPTHQAAARRVLSAAAPRGCFQRRVLPKDRRGRGPGRAWPLLARVRGRRSLPPRRGRRRGTCRA